MGKTTRKIRLLEENDIHQVAQIEQLSFSSPWSEQSFYEELENSLACYWIWEREDGNIGGYLGSWIILDEVQITNIAIHPDYRRERGAYLLLEQMFAHMKELDLFSATLEVRPSNEPAIHLYQKFGFQEAGRRAGYYEDDHEDALIFEVRIK